MAKKYRTNVNGAPILNVNFNGAPWTGNLKIDGVEVSYDDSPAPPLPPPAPPADTVWKLSGGSGNLVGPLLFTPHSAYSRDVDFGYHFAVTVSGNRFALSAEWDSHGYGVSNPSRWASLRIVNKEL